MRVVTMGGREEPSSRVTLISRGVASPGRVTAAWVTSTVYPLADATAVAERTPRNPSSPARTRIPTTFVKRPGWPTEVKLGYA